MEKLKILFMGTPEFAVSILDKIIKENYDVVGVITAPDKPAGRGQKIKYSAVKEYALLRNLRLFQPTNLKDETFIAELKEVNANVQVVVAFRMLPEVVWRMPKYGTFNLHASLLPNYRGAAPINWAIINGESESGVTTFFIDDKIDTGAMILQRKVSIEENDNAGVLHDKLMHLGSETVIETLDLIQKGTVRTTTQNDEGELKTAHKLNKDNCKIDFTTTPEKIYNLIRGLSPYPSAWCFVSDASNEWQIKIYEAVLEEQTHRLTAGTIVTTKKEIKIALSNGFLDVKRLQFPGKKIMRAHELLNGIRFSQDAIAF